MAIVILERFRPFTHLPGSSVLLPGSGILLRAFPTCLEFFDAGGEVLGTLKLGGLGAYSHYTLQQDLEKRRLQLLLEMEKGRCQVLLTLEEKQLSVYFKRAPEELKVTSDTFKEEDGRWVLALEKEEAVPCHQERLFLGCSKKQCWDRILRRASMAELLPLWHYLGLLSPHGRLGEESSLYREFFRNPSQETFKKLVRTSFSEKGLMVPERGDGELLGYPLPPWNASSPLAILSSGAVMIRSLFCEVRGDVVALLQNLPKELPSGRFVNVAVLPWLTLDMEWRKWKLRRLVLRTKEGGALRFTLPQMVGSCRIQKKGGETREIQIKDPIVLEEGSEYHLDQFR